MIVMQIVKIGWGIHGSASIWPVVQILSFECWKLNSCTATSQLYITFTFAGEHRTKDTHTQNEMLLSWWEKKNPCCPPRFLWINALKWGTEPGFFHNPFSVEEYSPHTHWGQEEPKNKNFSTIVFFMLKQDHKDIFVSCSFYRCTAGWSFVYFSNGCCDSLKFGVLLLLSVSCFEWGRQRERRTELLHHYYRFNRWNFWRYGLSSRGTEAAPGKCSLPYSGAFLLLWRDMPG